MKWKKPKNNSGKVVTEDDSKQMWKFKKKQKKSTNEAVAGTDKKARNSILLHNFAILLALLALAAGVYWLYTNDKLGPISPSKETTINETELPGVNAPPGESIQILTPEQIPDHIPYKEPKPAVSG